MTPPGTALAAIVAPAPPESVLDLVRKGRMFFSRPEAFALEVQGSKFDLGPATLFHRNLRVIDWETALFNLTSGSDGNVGLKMVPQVEQLIQVWLGN